jgi:DNA-binding MarR family transcriptional regulator
MPPRRHTQGQAAEALVAVAPLASRWIERLLARHDPALTVAQYLALRAIAHEDLTAVELARRTGVSGPAVSQLLTGLVEAGMLDRVAQRDDHRRHALTLTPAGARSFASAQTLLRESSAPCSRVFRDPRQTYSHASFPKSRPHSPAAPPRGVRTRHHRDAHRDRDEPHLTTGQWLLLSLAVRGR